jgi:hypothetical protein
MLQFKFYNAMPNPYAQSTVPSYPSICAHYEDEESG